MRISGRLSVSQQCVQPDRHGTLAKTLWRFPSGRVLCVGDVLPFDTSLITGREDDRVDHKVDASSTLKIVHDIGAFANTHGGWVIVGVEDDGTVVGIKDFQTAEAAITQASMARTDPPMTPRIFSKMYEGKRC